MIELVDNLINLIFAQLVIKTLQIIHKILFRFLQLAYLLFFHIEPFNWAGNLFKSRKVAKPFFKLIKIFLLNLLLYILVLDELSFKRFILLLDIVEYVLNAS